MQTKPLSPAVEMQLTGAKAAVDEARTKLRRAEDALASRMTNVYKLGEGSMAAIARATGYSKAWVHLVVSKELIRREPRA